MKQPKIIQKVDLDNWLMAVILAVALFCGEPDLVDAAIAALMALADYLTSLAGVAHGTA